MQVSFLLMRSYRLTEIDHIWNGNKSRRQNGSGSQPHPAAQGLGSVAPFFPF